MSEPGLARTQVSPIKALAQGVQDFQPARLDTLSMPNSHDERLEWVKKSYERFFEKVREYDALMTQAELN